MNSPQTPGERAASRYHAGAAFDRLRAALARLRDHRDESARVAGDALTAEAVDALRTLAERAEQADPDLARRKASDLAKRERLEARLGEARNRRGVPRQPVHKLDDIKRGAST